MPREKGQDRESFGLGIIRLAEAGVGWEEKGRDMVKHTPEVGAEGHPACRAWGPGSEQQGDTRQALH